MSLRGSSAPPPPGTVTVCETRCELVAVPAAEAAAASGAGGAAASHLPAVLHSYPKIVARRGCWSAEGKLRRLQGGGARAAEDDSSNTSVMACSGQLMQRLLGGSSGASSAAVKRALASLSTAPNWAGSTIRHMAFHPTRPRLAVALYDDAIEIHELDGHQVCLREMGEQSGPRHVLVHEDWQRTVACVSWCPSNPTRLAVGCRLGILVWEVSRHGQSTARLLPGPAVHTLSWSPDGAQLAAASPFSSSVFIWDVDLESCSELRRAGIPREVLWSPDGARLLVTTSSNVFRVWNTSSWTCERWANTNSFTQTACWSPDGQILLFSEHGETIVYSLQFRTHLEQQIVVLLDAAPVTFPDNQTAGGGIQAMAWDGSGERVVLSFRDGEYGCPLAAVFRCRMHSIQPELLASGFIRGPAGAHPQWLGFQPRTAGGEKRSQNVGAVLAMNWLETETSTSTVSFYPFFFQPSSK